MPSSSGTDFAGLWIPLVTPFHHQAVDHAALARLAAHYPGRGARGLVVCGSTGEAAALSADEQLAVLHTVGQAAPGVPLIMGLSGYHLGDTLEWVRQLTQPSSAARSHPALPAPLHGLLVPAPYYIRPAQAGLLHWFTTIADAAGRHGVPTVIYDIPARTGAHISTDTLLALAAHPHIRAVKDCGNDPAKTQALIADGRLQVLAGDDANLFTTAAAGGVGAIAASAHFQTARFAATLEHLRAGRLLKARQAWQPLLPLIAAAFAEPNPCVIKAGLAQQGWVAHELRLPMTEASAAATRGLMAALCEIAPVN